MGAPSFAQPYRAKGGTGTTLPYSPSCFCSLRPEPCALRPLPDRNRDRRTSRPSLQFPAFPKRELRPAIQRTRPAPSRKRILLLKKPGRMKWTYSQPQGKLFVLDGHNAYFYAPGQTEVQRVPCQKTRRPAIAATLPARPHRTRQRTDQPDSHSAGSQLRSLRRPKEHAAARHLASLHCLGRWHDSRHSSRRSRWLSLDLHLYGRSSQIHPPATTISSSTRPPERKSWTDFHPFNNDGPAEFSYFDFYCDFLAAAELSHCNHGSFGISESRLAGWPISLNPPTKAGAPCPCCGTWVLFRPPQNSSFPDPKYQNLPRVRDLRHGFQRCFPAHRCPSGFDLDRPLLPRPPMTEARPGPVDRPLHQSACDRVAVNVTALLQALPRCKDIEVIVTRLPERALRALHRHRQLKSLNRLR